MESLSLTNAQMDELRKEHALRAITYLRYCGVIVSTGGNIHGRNPKATAKRRAANKVARRQRRINRGS